MKIQIKNYVDERKVPQSISGYRILIDEWNSLTNKRINDVLFDKMLNLYASIKIWEIEFSKCKDFSTEIELNSDRYKMKKYNVFS